MQASECNTPGWAMCRKWENVKRKVAPEETWPTWDVVEDKCFRIKKDHTFSSGYAVLPQVAHFSCVPENMLAALLGDLV